MSWNVAQPANEVNTMYRLSGVVGVSFQVTDGPWDRQLLSFLVPGGGEIVSVDGAGTPLDVSVYQKSIAGAYIATINFEYEETVIESGRGPDELFVGATNFGVGVDWTSSEADTLPPPEGDRDPRDATDRLRINAMIVASAGQNDGGGAIIAMLRVGFYATVLSISP